MSDAPGPRRGIDPLGRGQRAFDDVYRRADSVLDRGQRHAFRLLWVFLPETSVARRPKFQQILASRFLSDAGQQAVAYGALIAVVRSGGSAFDAALVGTAALLPPAFFGLYGGAVADALPKRVALAAIYNLQAVLCFLVPGTLGTDLAPILLLVFAINALGQVSGPTESAVIPFVASEKELASAASLVSLASNAGTAFGTALLAPILVRAFGTDAVFYTAGGLLALAATRVFDLTTPQRRRRMHWRRPNINVRVTLRWIAHERAVATMMAVGVLAGTANIVLQTLAPRYVRTALDVDPADAVYVFAPSAAGMLLALALSPALIRRSGERIVALAGFVFITGSLVLLGLIDQDAGTLAAISPVRIAELFGVSLSDRMLAGGFLAIFIGLGSGLTTTSVQTYLNRRVPLSYQGRAFALQSTLKNGVAVVPLLTLGGLASTLGVETVLVFSPVILLIFAVALVELSVAFGGRAPTRRLDVLSTYWEESDVPVTDPFADESPGFASVSETPPLSAEDADDPEHQPA